MIFPRTPHPSGAVAAHYDELDPFYREIWGEHVHHGFWRTGRETPEQAAVALVDLLAERLHLAPGLRGIDIGCGYGATAHLLADRCDMDVTGVTISEVQARRGAAGRATILHRDWLENGFADARFDVAWAIESSEHMADKAAFFAEAYRTLRPGGRLGVYAWLAREAPRAWEIRHLLEPICREGRLPGMGDEADYRRLAAAAGFDVVGVEDLSFRVRRTWSVCALRLTGKLATDRRYLAHLLNRSARNRIFVVTLLRILLAYRTGSMRYALFVFAKPASIEPRNA